MPSTGVPVTPPEIVQSPGPLTSVPATPPEILETTLDSEEGTPKQLDPDCTPKQLDPGCTPKKEKKVKLKSRRARLKQEKLDKAAGEEGISEPGQGRIPKQVKAKRRKARKKEKEKQEKLGELKEGDSEKRSKGAVQK